jgi:hypothetical protein
MKRLIKKSYNYYTTRDIFLSKNKVDFNYFDEIKRLIKKRKNKKDKKDESNEKKHKTRV